MLPLPSAFLARMEQQLGAEMPAFSRAMTDASVRGIRYHPRKTASHDYPDAGEPVPWEKQGRLLKTDSGAGTGLLHEAGAFYLQEPAAMLPGAVMNARPGEWILDLCAAPGGKATQMALAMEGQGLLVANDPVENRAHVLSRNLERMGVAHAVVTCAMPDALASRWPELFDAVMVDAPCSGEGMFRREPASRAEWKPEMAAGCVKRQREILTAAARLVRPGGRLVYATCTWNPEENSGNVRWFLSCHPEFAPEPFSLPGADGPEGMMTCYPHRVKGEGQFVALLRRSGSRTELHRTGPASGGLAPMTKEDLQAYAALLPDRPLPTSRLGETLCVLPSVPDLTGIRVIRAGLHAAERKGKILLPAHAAARAWVHEATIPLNGQEACAYLAGNPLPGETRGWMPVSYLGLPLGWIKGDGNLLKNHYPRGLRNEKIRADAWR